MKRCLTALAASLTLALAAGVGTASAGNLVPSPGNVPTVNSSDQGQVQIVPIAPQLNVQNVNVATLGEVEQGDVNNANTGQASQQETGQAPAPAPAAGNDSDQSQVQIVPIAPQANVQNVNVLTSGDVEQGDANNANTGQASQQETGQAPGWAPTARNDSDQSQVQIVPIAPQLNVQNVNVATHGDVEQGDANNANTGQASQQDGTTGSPKPTYAKPAPGKTEQPHSCGCQPKPSGHKGNSSKQKQIQVVPIAPQANVQNVNVLTFGDVEQGDANNANTGQASQQSRSHARQQPPTCSSRCAHPQPKPCDCKPKPQPKPEPKPQPKPEPKPCGCTPAPKPEPKPCDCKPAPKPEPTPHPEPCICKPAPDGPCGCKPNDQHGAVSDQKQIQVVPIAPQANLQNVNLLTFGEVEQGNANNANTGQASQQSSWVKGGPHKPGAPPVL